MSVLRTAEAAAALTFLVAFVVVPPLMAWRQWRTDPGLREAWCGIGRWRDQPLGQRVWRLIAAPLFWWLVGLVAVIDPAAMRARSPDS